ncbi:MAG: Gfo/Idh/MocA family oxidoreductase, partial [Akkermansiaceae bacterium]|nr:Gfo/Idh/MocA family oxidoreductase [Akkermansiaceae bacterium]
MKDQPLKESGQVAGKSIGRRSFAKGAAGTGLFQIVAPHVLGGPKHTPPSETFGAALIGVGGRGPGTFADLSRKHGLAIREIAQCDVKWVGKVDNKTRYTDFRRVLDRNDVDIVAIGTPPHWHAMISILAMEAGKDVVCEKPMTRFVAEGRAVVETARRTKRIFQIGTYGRFRQQKADNDLRKIVRAGLVNGREVRVIYKGGFKVRQWSGPVQVKPQPVPAYLDWDMYCGPSPLKPFHPPRFGGMHRGYWDYDGGGLADMGQHFLDPLTYRMGKDETAPVEIIPHAAPAHPEVTGMWGWVRMKYADGVELVLESGEWGEPHGLEERTIGRNDLNEEERRVFDAVPEEDPLVDFGEAVKTRELAGGHPEVAHRTVCLLHLANLAIRTGRTIRFDPETERAIGDEEANRLIDQPMRAPWHL